MKCQESRAHIIRRGHYLPLSSYSNPFSRGIRWFLNGVKDKTSWEWIELLFIPIILVLIAYLFQRCTANFERKIADKQREQDKQLNQENSEIKYLSNYLDTITLWLLSKDFEKTPEELRSIIRAKTLTTLRNLKSERKGVLIRFMHEQNLISGKKAKYNVSLKGSDLRTIDLKDAWLPDIQLARSYMMKGILVNSDLIRANLTGTDLKGADLTGADLTEAKLMGTNLTGINLSTTTMKGSFYTDKSTSNKTCTFLKLSKQCPTIFPKNFSPEKEEMRLFPEIKETPQQ